MFLFNRQVYSRTVLISFMGKILSIASAKRLLHYVVRALAKMLR